MATILQFPRNVVGAKAAHQAMIERGRAIQASRAEVERACSVAVFYVSAGLSSAAATQMGWQTFRAGRPVSHGGYAA